MPEQMSTRTRLATSVLWGALADLAVFCASFAFFGGPHGPIGPMLVLSVLNAPVNQLFNRLFPEDQTSNATDTVLMFVVVLVSGALYGLVAGLIAPLWRRARGSTSEPPASLAATKGDPR